MFLNRYRFNKRKDLFVSFAFIFPGQGSQSLKMLDGFLACSEVQNTFAIAKEVLDVDFLALLQEETPDTINQTINTQPLLLAASYAIYLSYLKQGGAKPSVMAGHSLGEWTALVASGVIDFTSALRLVKIRATAMQEAVAPGAGAMAAVIGLDDDKITDVCKKIAKELNLVVAGVNFNSPGQVVIAGDTAAVEKASLELKAVGARMVKMLPVSVPSHCSLMQSAADKLAQALEGVKFNSPQIPVLHNFNAESYDDIDKIKSALVKQLYLPVLWSKTINQIVGSGIRTVVEVGPNSVLTGLNKRINPDIVSFNLHKDELSVVINELKVQ
jgi:[acyl-carrier-protein] S-malonyltransferase